MRKWEAESEREQICSFVHHTRTHREACIQTHCTLHIHTFFSKDIHSLQTHQVWQLVNDFFPLTTCGFVDSLNGPSLPVCPVYVVTCTQKLL